MTAQKTRKTKKLSLKKLLKNGTLLVLCAYVVYTVAVQQVAFSKCGRAAEEYEGKLAEAKLEEERLRAELKNTEKDEYLERMAREKLGLVKANERVYMDVTEK